MEESAHVRKRLIPGGARPTLKEIKEMAGNVRTRYFNMIIIKKKKER